MSTSISPSNKSNIVTYRNNTNNSDHDRDRSVTSGIDTNAGNEDFNEGYDAKVTRIKDELNTLVNHRTTIPYISDLRPGN